MRHKSSARFFLERVHHLLSIHSREVRIGARVPLFMGSQLCRYDCWHLCVLEKGGRGHQDTIVVLKRFQAPTILQLQYFLIH